jgi:Ca2+-binding EF-hand superfamily protein
VYRYAEGVDVDGDGAIDRDEMWDGLEALGLELSESQVDMLWEKCDADGSGELDIAEFGKAVKMVGLCTS